jgi:hypothetical protein
LALAIVGMAALPFALGACGSSSKNGTASTAGAGENTFGLSEFTIAPPTGALHSGPVTLTANNVGGEAHELVIVRAPSFDSLPTKPDGAVDEDKIAESDKMGEIEDVAAQSQKSNSFDLAPGKYVAFCNVVDKATGTAHDGESESGHVHFASGMHVEFSVS